MRAFFCKALLPILAAWPLFAIETEIQRGASVFAKSCGSGYCHATEGSGGGAPRLAARGLERNLIRNVVANGVTGTRMSGYASALSAGDLAAVVAYVASLNDTAVAASSAKRTFVGAAARGRTLFSEATRGFARCSTCHQTAGIGIAVAPPIRTVPLTVAVLKTLATPRVATATFSGETVPGVVVAQRTQDVNLYDLSSVPPVLRTLEPGQVTIREGSAWSHATALGSYSDTELTAILAFLRAAR